MTIRLNDLPAELRARVQEQAGGKGGGGKRASHAGVGDADPCPYRCCTCGETFESYSKANRHLDREHASTGRLEVVFA